MATWSLAVLLGGTDITARLVGELDIDAERGAARVCGLYYRPAGSVAPRDLEGLTLTIDLTTNTAGTVRRFTGRVFRVKANSESGVVYVMGQDSLKAQANGATLATLQTWCPLGLYHEAVFGPRTTGWNQLRDLASTSGGTVECGPTDAPRANPLRVTGPADLTYTKYLAGSLEEGSLDLDGLVNSCVITFAWRHTRLWSRPHTLAWNWGIEWCDLVYGGEAYWQNQWLLPQVSEVQSFDGKAGWSFQTSRQLSGGDPLGPGFNGEYLPVSDNYDCGNGPFVWINKEEDSPQSLTRFGVRLERRGVQAVTRTYTLTLACAASIARYGTRTATDQASGETPYDPAGWVESQGSGVPADGVSGWANNGIGDRQLDVVDEADMDAAMRCILQHRRDAMRASHRRPLAWVVPLALECELTSTVTLDSARVSAGPGRVHRITDRLTFPSSGNGYQGRAVTRIELHLSRSQYGTQTDDALDPPAAPATLPTHTPHASTTNLANHIGNWSGAPAWNDEGMIGWRANRLTYTGGGTPNPYPSTGFNFDLPDIEEEMTNEVLGTTAATYAVAIDHETLTGGD
jgi:hypothetical protein